MTVTEAPPIAEPSRTERFCARLDQHLEGMPPEARQEFLRKQQIEWIAKFDRFTARVEAGEEPHWGETAYDYADTLAEIGRRIQQEGVS